jgi:hypothetical protein
MTHCRKRKRTSSWPKFFPMNRQLEALVQAYDATKQARPEEVNRLRATYEARLDDVLEHHPNLSRSTLEAMVRIARGRWLKAQERPTAPPPKA